LKKSQNQKLPNRFSFHGRGNYRTNVALPGNNGSFRNVLFSLQRLILKTKRAAVAATVALSSIKQAASK
jgi:hypothetical protein